MLNVECSPMNPLWHILYRFYRVVSWLRHWVRRRFTRAGLVVLGAVIVAGMMGIDTDNTVSYQAFTLLLFLLLVAVSFGWIFRVRFSVTRLLPRFGTAGQPFSYRVAVTNLTARTQHGLTLLDDLADPRPSFSEWLAAQYADEKHFRPFRIGRRRHTHPFTVAMVKEAAVPTAPAHRSVEVRVELTPLRRGVLRFRGATLARPDPLGLF